MCGRHFGGLFRAAGLSLPGVPAKARSAQKNAPRPPVAEGRFHEDVRPTPWPNGNCRRSMAARHCRGSGQTCCSQKRFPNPLPSIALRREIHREAKKIVAEVTGLRNKASPERISTKGARCGCHDPADKVPIGKWNLELLGLKWPCVGGCVIYILARESGRILHQLRRKSYLDMRAARVYVIFIDLGLDTLSAIEHISFRMNAAGRVNALGQRRIRQRTATK